MVNLSTYNPLNDSVYMSDQMLAYFKNKLLKMHQKIIKEENAISLSLVDAPNRDSDPIDRGSNEELAGDKFTFQEHEDHIRHEIEAALERINTRIYGYCEETCEPIGVKRLLAVPYARYSLSVQTHKEKD